MAKSAVCGHCKYCVDCGYPDREIPCMLYTKVEDEDEEPHPQVAGRKQNICKINIANPLWGITDDGLAPRYKGKTIVKVLDG